MIERRSEKRLPVAERMGAVRFPEFGQRPRCVKFLIYGEQKGLFSWGEMLFTIYA
jgi:hypothetical protein